MTIFFALDFCGFVPKFDLTLIVIYEMSSFSMNLPGILMVYLDGGGHLIFFFFYT